MKNCLKKRSFTLIELLVVISIIAVLASLLFPVISVIKTSAKKAKAKALANDLVTAIKEYETVYMQLPVQPSDLQDADNKEYIKDDTKYDRLITILSCSESENGNGVDSNGVPNDGNVRGEHFLEVANMKSDSSFLDPWGNRFKIGMDGKYDKKVKGF